MATAQRNSAGQPPAQKKGPKDIGDLKRMFSQAKAIRERFIPEWYLNLAFYHGIQWGYWNRGRIDMPRLADWRRTPVDNRITPIVTARAARKVKNRPVFVCTPHTADERDIQASAIGEKVLAADWTNYGLTQNLYQALLFADICGAGFWKIYWDSTKGKSIQVLVGPGGQVVTQNNGTPVTVETFGGQVPEGFGTKLLSQGDICFDVLSPFELFPDPMAKTLAECEWVVEEKVRSVEYLNRRYPNFNPIPDASAPIGPVESRLSPSLTYSPQGEGEEYKGVKVYELWMRPCTDYPQGCRFVWANEEILMHEEAPFDPMPYVMFSGVRSPNRFWPRSLVSDLRPPQIELNKLEAQIAENAARIGNPAVMKSRQANVHYTGVPGEEVLYDSTVTDAVPSYLEPPEMPEYVLSQLERIENTMSEISGIHEVSKAQVPTGVTAASAINLLQEADDTRIGPEIQDMETTLAEAGTKTLRLRAKFNSDERLVRIAGEDGNWDIFSFRGEMLGDEQNINVDVQAGSGMPRSKAAKQAAMLEVLQVALQYGLQVNPRDLRRFFKDYEVAALERLFENISADEQQIQRENRLMSQGTALNINPDFDDHALHIEGHNEFRKSGQYARLSPMAQQAFELHVKAHQEFQVQTVNQQLQVGQMEGQQQLQLAAAQAQEQQAHEAQMQAAKQNGGGG